MPKNEPLGEVGGLYSENLKSLITKATRRWKQQNKFCKNGDIIKINLSINESSMKTPMASFTGKKS